MEKLPDNPNCELSGTKYCHLLNMGNCERCTIRTSERKSEIRDDLELYETLLPEGGVARLFTGTACGLCKNEPKNPRSGYAIIDMAHPEPKRAQRWLLGKKVSNIGTMIPVQLGVCAKCRRTLMLIDYLPIASAVVVGGVGLLVLGSGRVADTLADISTFLPFAIWIAATLIGLLCGRLAGKLVAARAAERMYVHVLDHPVLAEMVRKGWTPVSGAKSKVFFSRSRVARGLGTAAGTFTERLDAPGSTVDVQNS